MNKPKIRLLSRIPTQQRLDEVQYSFELEKDIEKIKIVRVLTQNTLIIIVGSTLRLTLAHRQMIDESKKVTLKFLRGEIEYMPAIISAGGEVMFYKDAAPDEYKILVKYDFAICMAVLCQHLLNNRGLPTRIGCDTNIHMAPQFVKIGFDSKRKGDDMWVSALTGELSLKYMQAKSLESAEDILLRIKAQHSTYPIQPLAP
jgi:hypothetical protein